MKPLKRKIKSKTNLELETLLQTKYLEEENCENPKIMKYSNSIGPGHIPPEAKQILDKWMFNHRFYCYPSKTEKQQLSLATNLSVQRISNWFVNSRRRILPKMIENDGKNVSDFIITRKRQRQSMAPRPQAHSQNQKNQSLNNETCLNQSNDNDFEYTLSGLRVLKHSKMELNEQLETEMRLEQGPLKVNELERYANPGMPEEQTLPECNASPIVNTSYSGLIVDHTTNLNYLYVLVESSTN